ncbi:peptidoglycan/LPS O-acetylase OafA/YrhL [Pelomonas saccharophila]|uniref:Peptidoglycan/LPS O-acetylase OafA/YrhL n=1 Tax=Roseateles saccharophilus TaxID=304 RepID=A0ABU1YFJ0_ROSSA|nr:acyltransferase [Roseateles saccharophilus]MDR7267625.1 peptidoglycan/LPS O-acetylase OafA/YrhL [Roseateles saccharophilus]
MDLLGPVSPLPAVAALLLAFATAALLQRRSGAPQAPGRFAGIDGLRGYLALGVFLHHACIWYFYQHSGEWKLPPSRLYTHLGHSSVAVFFMITGFLFFSKLIDSRQRPLDWLKLFVSRLLRLLPLYLVVMGLLFVTVAVLSGGELHEPARTVTKQALRWLGFTMYGNPPINQVEATKIVVAGVTWSLPYEWFFYGMLPLLALTVGVRARWPYLLLGLVSLLALLDWHALPVHLWAFAGGIAAAWAVRWPALCRLAPSRVASLLILAAVAAVGLFPLATDYGVLVPLTIAFVLVACGNTLFGLLLHPASRLLGEMAYSIYLLHGLLLFGLFHFALGADRAALDAGVHWAWALALAPVLVLVSHVSFRFIEAPAMQATPALTAALRRRFQRSPDRLPA